MATTVSTKTKKQPKVLDGLHLGLPNFWYPILRTAELGDRPICVRRFGQDLAVWRDASGAARIRAMVDLPGDAKDDSSEVRNLDRRSSTIAQLERWLNNVRGGM